jgi:hypothetical protein
VAARVLVRFDADVGLDSHLPLDRRGAETSAAIAEGAHFVPGLAPASTDVVFAYVDVDRLAGGWLGVRAGRQVVSDVLGWWSFDGLRVPLLRPAGQHGIYNPQPFRPFDADAYMVSFTVRYLATRGRAVGHEPGCDCSASGLPAYSVAGEPSFPALGEAACGPSDLRLCDATCASAWGIVTPDANACEP